MNPSPDRDEKLARFIHQTLRDLPPRHAPRTLEARVLAELKRRAALPWWRQSYAHWPLAVRCVFLLASAGVAKVALMATIWVLGGLDAAQFADAFAPQVAWLHTAVNLSGSFANFCGTVVGRIPPLWLYGAAAFVVTMYGALFGLGAVAYRTLYADHTP